MRLQGQCRSDQPHYWKARARPGRVRAPMSAKPVPPPHRDRLLHSRPGLSRRRPERGLLGGHCARPPLSGHRFGVVVRPFLEIAAPRVTMVGAFSVGRSSSLSARSIPEDRTASEYGPCWTPPAPPFHL